MTTFFQAELASPYKDQPVENWLATTEGLIENHPLSIDEIREAVHVAWDRVWSTQIGSGRTRLALQEINPPATVIGYFFEKILGKELAIRYPGEWISGNAGEQKDLHCVEDKKYSIEVKTSGQLGLKIYGNRSYAQDIENPDKAKKDKSGYYITVNFHGRHINLIRFGWIDGSDWVPQKSPTGQAAGLGPEVYAYKLIPIDGDYTLDAPLQLLDGVGVKIAAECMELDIYSIRDALNNQEKLTGKHAKVYRAALLHQKMCGS
jgi:hypothetical protein